MNIRLNAWLERLGDQFWLRPAIVVVLCIASAQGAVWIDAADLLAGATSTSSSPWGYSGGADGARALLGAVASSSIGVAGTIFSITIAALSLASGQMGPRLLRNFVRDSRNQLALGIFVGTFAYALVVLRTIRGEEDGFIPHAAVTGAIALAMVCVATLVWFVHHIATSINVEKVVDVVHAELIGAVATGTLESADMARAAFEPGRPVSVGVSGYLQAVDLDGLADWAAKTRTNVRLTVRPGDYVPLGMPVAEVLPLRDDAGDALGRALTFGSQPAALQDLEYPIRQLTEIAVRALSPGINDPFTAGSVLERLGDALCRISPRFLPTGALARDGEIVLLHDVTTYGGLCDAMFDTIRQNGAGSAYVLIRLLDVLTKVARVERTTSRLAEVSRHADLALAAGRGNLNEEAALSGLLDRHAAFHKVVAGEPLEQA